ncbi:uncharacterized protein PFL1_01635 [Pseudozyma flocculosa PF-1]|nr:uncharacterized protein PFL1_01635 [Pseudozyma flocculosa PF-1]EPQ30734.1 hypothetical protein PFL1_01635 [Pseudozyma flocculosa PF-1]
MTDAASSNSQAGAGAGASKDLRILATTYNGTVLPYSVDPSTSSFDAAPANVAAKQFGQNPGWVCYAPSFSTGSRDASRRILYIADGASGNMFAASLKSADPLQLDPIGQPVSSKGQEPVSCSVGHGASANMLFVANYGTGSLAYFHLDPKTGEIDESSRQTYQFTREGTGPVKDRQDHSYAHQTQISPTGDWVYICDLGADVVHRFQITAAKGQQAAKVEYKGDTKVDVGSGPRHITFYPSLADASKKAGDDKMYAYLASELSSTVTAFEHDAATGELKQLGKPLYPFPAGTPLSGPGILPTNRTTAEIEVSPDGRFVYVSNRGDKKEDHITIFSRDAHQGTLRFEKWIGSGGLLPRHFSLSSPADGTAGYLVSAHQDSQDLVLFKRNVQTGDLEKVKKIPDVGVVVYAGFLPA